MFYLDVKGESMLERLSLRIRDTEVCAAVMRLGVTLFDGFTVRGACWAEVEAGALVGLEL